MKEATATTEIIRSIRFNGGWAYKIPDAPITKELLKITRFTAAKPCDIVSIIKNKFVAIEVKQIKSWKALSIRQMRPEQIKQLTEIIGHGGRAFIFLNVRIAKPKENRLIVLDWEYWGESLLSESIKAKDLKEFGFYKHFNHEDKIHFDLKEWVEWL